MNCRESVSLMHEYLDGDLAGSKLLHLNHHLSSCHSCKAHLRQLEKTDAFLRSLPKSRVSEGITERIMQALPEERKTRSWARWARRYPGVSVAVVFLVVMFASIATIWNQDDELIVKGANLDQLVIEGDTVTVPEGSVIEGNLVVENGKLDVQGTIQGNLTIVDGEMNLASTAYVGGKVSKVNQWIDWFWYKVSGMVTAVAP